MDYPYFNGTVWETKMFHRCVLTFLSNDSWCLLAIDKGTHGGFVGMAYHEVNGKWLYKSDEIVDRLSKNWKCVGVWFPKEWHPMEAIEPLTELADVLPIG